MKLKVPKVEGILNFSSLSIMNTLFPLFVVLKGKTCTVVGGGTVALRKILGLLECEASVRVIALTCVPEIIQLKNDQKIELLLRPYQQGDFTGSFLVVAATNDLEVNRQIYQECTEVNILCNVVDSRELCNFYYASAYTCGDLKIAISTNGISPALARKIKAELAARYSAEFVPYLKYLQKMRAAVQAKIPEEAKRKEILEKIVADPGFLNQFQAENFCRALENLDFVKELDKWCHIP